MEKNKDEWCPESCEEGFIHCHNPVTNEAWVEDCPACGGKDE